MIIAALGTWLLIRIMVEALFITFRDIFTINHIRLPEPGWQLEVVKVTLAFTLAVPIIGAMVAYQP